MQHPEFPKAIRVDAVVLFDGSVLGFDNESYSQFAVTADVAMPVLEKLGHLLVAEWVVDRNGVDPYSTEAMLDRSEITKALAALATSVWFDLDLATDAPITVVGRVEWWTALVDLIDYAHFLVQTDLDSYGDRPGQLDSTVVLAQARRRHFLRAATELHHELTDGNPSLRGSIQH